MNNFKFNLLRFLVSRSGGIITPIIAGIVATVVAKLAAFDSNLASSIDQTAIVAFVVAAIMSGVNYFTNAAQTDGIKRIQALVNTDEDGVPGPVTYTEVRKAIPVNS
jgi:uncharacterized membrane protein YeaQ/YmgE (transglycosylase-associated protein family)